MVHLHEIHRVVKIIETESRMAVARDGRVEMHRYCLMGAVLGLRDGRKVRR